VLRRFRGAVNPDTGKPVPYDRLPESQEPSTQRRTRHANT
jgi:hypothetical protein